MPYQSTWIDPELLFEHNGINVYRAYKDDDFERPLAMYIAVYRQNNSSRDEDEIVFDVRELPGAGDGILEGGWDGAPTVCLHMERVVKAAIDNGIIRKLMDDHERGGRSEAEEDPDLDGVKDTTITEDKPLDRLMGKLTDEQWAFVDRHERAHARIDAHIAMCRATGRSPWPLPKNLFEDLPS